MRAIGQIPQEAHARAFSDYLLVQGIQNQIDPDDNGQWVVWVQEDHELERAASLLKGFLENPAHPEYRKATAVADRLREKEQQEEKAWRKRFFQGAASGGAPRCASAG